MTLTGVRCRIASSEARARLVDNLLSAFGLTGAADVLVGTPVRKGMSGGQKRRVSVASQLVTGPKLLFLDEPTSGLDSTASHETMSFIREIARKFKLVVVCSIHQPSTSTFNLFDTLCLLGAGRVCYYGRVQQTEAYFDRVGFPLPLHVNPAEYLLELVNIDFYTPAQTNDPAVRLAKIHNSWTESLERIELLRRIQSTSSSRPNEKDTLVYPPSGHVPSVDQDERPPRTRFLVPVLLHRAFIKSYRDVFVYGVRVAMYLGE
jgi:ABC-type multidrug transport system ATPase subunit